MRAQDREFYSSETDYFEPHNQGYLVAHYAVVSSYVKTILPSIQARGRDRALEILELGAGTCTATMMLKQKLPTAHFSCLDISLSRMQSLIGLTGDRLGVSAEGVRLYEGDFTNELPFSDSTFDIVVFDAALHHTRNIWKTLEECHRVLKPDGAVTAMREAYLAKFTSGHAMRRLVQSPEFAAGVAENAFLKEQYDYYFRAAKFDPKFVAVNPRGWALLAPLNGLLFSKWTIWAPKDVRGDADRSQG